eukprot:m51a1_g10173 hypothetical protein (236) ;mRNA; r:758-6699
MDCPGEITQPPDLMDMYHNDCLRPIMRKRNYISVVEELTYLWDHVKEMHEEAHKSAPEDAELELWMWHMSFEDIFFTLKAQAHCTDTFMTMPKFASSWYLTAPDKKIGQAANTTMFNMVKSAMTKWTPEQELKRHEFMMLINRGQTDLQRKRIQLKLSADIKRTELNNQLKRTEMDTDLKKTKMTTRLVRLKGLVNEWVPSTDPYPVDLNDLWGLLGYTRKDNAVEWSVGHFASK